MDAGDGFSDPELDPLDSFAPDAHRPAGGRPQGRFQPKLKGKAKVKVKSQPAAASDGKTSTRAPSPPSAPAPTFDRREDELLASAEVSKSESVFPGPSTSGSSSRGVYGKEEAVEVEREEGKEDEVIREIDVFFNPAPLDQDTQLYVMQYPYRPFWRPYEFDESCVEVRVKPKESKVEVDFSIDVDSQNYDKNATVRIEKQDRKLVRFHKLSHDFDNIVLFHTQTLSSSKAPFVTDYAVGLLSANKLHLSPINTVVQLRTLMGHMNFLSQRKKHSEQNVEASTSSIDNELHESTKEKLIGPDENIEDSEPWISLEYHGIDSRLTERYHNKMVAEDSDPINFTMKKSHYLNSLCPGTSMDNNRTKSELRRTLLKLPLKERLKKWLHEGSQVNRFDALMHLAPGVPDKELLEVLQHHANLVQGLWVSKSSLLQYDGRMLLARDYILRLFNKNPLIPMAKLRRIDAKALRLIMGPLAEERHDFQDWKFTEASDLSFINKYPTIVAAQEAEWSNREKKIVELLSSKSKAPTNIPHPDNAKRKAPSKAMSKETREHLPKVLVKVFQEQRVRSLSSIIRGLRDFAIFLSSRPKDDPKTKILINAATEGASAEKIELQSILSQVSVNVHGVYVLKNLDNPALDPLRTVVIDIFCSKKPNEKVTKQEVSIAAKSRLKKDISDPEFNQVMHELCTFSKGEWELKSSD